MTTDIDLATPAGRAAFAAMGQRITISVRVLPPSVNHMYAPNADGSKRLTDQARAFREFAGYEARVEAARAGFRPAPRMALTMRLTFGDRRNQDIDNRVKAALDALALALGFNDSCVDRIVIERAGYDKGRPLCEMTLEAL